MIQLIQFSKGYFCIAAGPRPYWSPGEGQCSIEFDFGEGGTIPELHRCQFMDFVNAIDPVRAPQILNLVLELFNAHTRVGGIDFDLFNAACERLETSGTPDVQIEFSSCAVKGASCEEYISLTFRKYPPD
jgi:hypothetical protein